MILGRNEDAMMSSRGHERFFFFQVLSQLIHVGSYDSSTTGPSNNGRFYLAATPCLFIDTKKGLSCRIEEALGGWPGPLILIES